MHYEVSGEGKDIILIHGLFGNLDNLKGLSRQLEQKYRVWRIDLPNHGLSAHTHDMHYAAMAQALIEFMDRKNLASAHLVGHSMGGKVAMAVALTQSNRVLSLVAADIAPVAYHARHTKVFEGMTSLPLDRVKDRRDALTYLTDSGIDESTAQFLLKNLQRTDTRFNWKLNLNGLQECYSHLIDWPYTALKYEGPTLFVRGDQSDYVLSDHRQAILAQFPNVQAKTIIGAGHWLHAQKPAQFNRIVEHFIDKATNEAAEA
ncbi:MAG: alpha/beta fold hydrolase [Shewanella sp.]|nr:alpha/beta fold hydrolase [Shewanella sp.]MCF1430205.1 alpha/beta fold hydrolase [Shewanella sp.]MCF1438062.1 alpha/beta fold hydrolase [Shewanella sp.]MCF1459241.1 alpha/beta fold hydrolase [Shewanella sp.]